MSTHASVDDEQFGTLAWRRLFALFLFCLRPARESLWRGCLCIPVPFVRCVVSCVGGIGHDRRGRPRYIKNAILFLLERGKKERLDRAPEAKKHDTKKKRDGIQRRSSRFFLHLPFCQHCTAHLGIGGQVKSIGPNAFLVHFHTLSYRLFRGTKKDAPFFRAPHIAASPPSQIAMGHPKNTGLGMPDESKNDVSLPHCDFYGRPFF
nr:hypothetical protein [Pandoravirus massiliensis]